MMKGTTSRVKGDKYKNGTVNLNFKHQGLTHYLNCEQILINFIYLMLQNVSLCVWVGET